MTRPTVQAYLTRGRCSKTIAPSLDARAVIRLGAAAAVAALIALAAPAAASAQTFGVFTVDKTADEFDGECTADCTLREAVTLAGQTQAGGTPSISVPAGVYRLTRGALQLRTMLILGAGTVGGQGAGARTTIIDARGQSRVVEVASETQAIVAGVTLRGGSATDGGGAHIAAGGVLSLYNAHRRGQRRRHTGRRHPRRRHRHRAELDDQRQPRHDGSGGGIAGDVDGDIVDLPIDGERQHRHRATAAASPRPARSRSSARRSRGNSAAAAAAASSRRAPTGSFVSMSDTIVASNPSGGACGGAIGDAPARTSPATSPTTRAAPSRGSEGQQGVDPRLAAAAQQRRADRHAGARGRAARRSTPVDPRSAAATTSAAPRRSGSATSARSSSAAGRPTHSSRRRSPARRSTSPVARAS